MFFQKVPISATNKQKIAIVKQSPLQLNCLHPPVTPPSKEAPYLSLKRLSCLLDFHHVFRADGCYFFPCERML